MEELTTTPLTAPVGVELGTNVIVGRGVIEPATTAAGIGALAWLPGAVTVTAPLELTGKFTMRYVPLAPVIAVAVVPKTGSVKVAVAPEIGKPVAELTTMPETDPVVGMGGRVILGTVTVAPAITTTGSGTLAIKPGACAVTVPALVTGTPRKIYAPLLLVIASKVIPVSVSRRVTVAPGKGTPPTLRTKPETVPVSNPCALEVWIKRPPISVRAIIAVSAIMTQVRCFPGELKPQ